MKKLQAEVGDRVQFLTIFIREAHPGGHSVARAR